MRSHRINGLHLVRIYPSLPNHVLTLPFSSDIIVLLILGVCLVGVFLYWQHILERAQDDPARHHAKFYPPPLMKLTIWTRANWRFAAMMALAFMDWCSFLSWTYWVQVGF